MFSIIFILFFSVIWTLFILYFPIKLLGILIGFFIGLLLTWIMVFLVFMLCMMIVKRLKINHIFQYKVISGISRLIIRFFRIRLIVHNSHLIPISGKLIIYSNHKNNFDPFIIACVLKRAITFSPKDELYHKYFYSKLLSFCFNAARCLKIVRGDNRTTIQNINKSLMNIQQGLAMVIFPEGGVVNIHSDSIISSLDGAYKIALQSQAAILPITLRGAYKIRQKCWFRPKKIEVFIHPYIPFSDYQSKKTHQINQYVTNIINSVL